MTVNTGPGSGQEQGIRQVRRLDEVDLFLFSAALWLPHRIHYDRDYTRTEGHEDLLVHGPLQAAIATEMIARHVRSSALRVCHVSYRHVAPAFVNSTLAFAALPDPEGSGSAAGSFAVTVGDAQSGQPTTKGVVEVGPMTTAPQARGTLPP